MPARKLAGAAIAASVKDQVDGKGARGRLGDDGGGPAAAGTAYRGHGFYLDSSGRMGATGVATGGVLGIRRQPGPSENGTKINHRRR